MSIDGHLGPLADAVEIGMVVLGPGGRIALWNLWMQRTSGIPGAEAVGRRIDALFPTLAGGRLTGAVDRALDQGLSSLLGSSLNRALFPLVRLPATPGRAEPMRQVVLVKPQELGGTRHALVQVFDVTTTAARETAMRQQTRTMEALAENYRLSELHTRAIVDHTADAIITFSEDGAINTYNPAAERIFGYDPYEIVGKSIAVLIPELGGGEAGGLRIDRFLDQRTEVSGIRRDFRRFPLELSLASMELGGQRLFIAIGHDITVRKANEAELHNQKEWLTTLINALPDLICFKDGKGRWLVANQFYLEMIGLTGVDYVGQTAKTLAEASPAYREFLGTSLGTDERAWRERRAITYEKAIHPPDRPARIFDMTKIPLFHSDGSRRGLVLVGRDITDRKLAAARIQHLAHHDSLTDLPNRVLFQERLKRALSQASRSGGELALMFLDLDKFKEVNDTLGHHIGDLLLKAVAKRIEGCVRETDTVARLGGDEFAVVLTNLDGAEGAARVADSIIAALARPFRLDDIEVQTSTSIGITLFPADAAEADKLLKNADLAMFRSKAEGRNGYSFYVTEMDAEIQARKALERDLREALDGDQMELHYQPLVDLGSGRVIGAEALLRWRHPVRGWVSPAEFIPVVERTDMIGPLGIWILRQACSQARRWLDMGLDAVKIAVNLSPAQFRQSSSLVTTIEDILRETGMAADHLQLEITEGIAMQNVEATIEVLQSLRAMGVIISIDDFGTGYSSLNYLKRFPVDKLKIDRSFVADIGLHPDNAAVVEAIVNLGHSLGTRVNVEGVETDEQLGFLVERRVDEAQGFLFARALPPAEFADLVRRRTRWPL